MIDRGIAARPKKEKRQKNGGKKIFWLYIFAPIFLPAIAFSVALVAAAALRPCVEIIQPY